MGVAVGLARGLPAGGDVLFIEANRMKGKGNFTITGQIGDVMKESMQAALTWVQVVMRPDSGLDEDVLKDVDPAHPCARRERSRRMRPSAGCDHGDGSGLAC